MPTSSTKSHRDPENYLPNKKLPCIVQSFYKLTSEGKLSEAVASLELISRKGIRLPTKTLAHLLQQCGNAKSLKLGKWVHLHLKLTGLKRPDAFLSDHLMSMYLKCGDHFNASKVFNEMSERSLYTWNNLLSGFAKLGMVKQARTFFDKMPERDVVSWNTMVIAYAQSGFLGEALRFYKEFRRSGIGYNDYSLAGLLTVCVKFKELGLTRQAHGQVLVGGFLLNVVISSSVVDAYVKCEEMGDARRFFDEMNVRDVMAWTTMVSGYAQWGDMDAAVRLFELMPNRNSVSWTSLISGYARHGLGYKALELFREMMVLQFTPDQFTFSSCLCACASMASLKHGKQLHGYLVRSNFRPNTIVVSSLIDMYSKCGSLETGRRVFNLMGNKQDAVLWNTMISALAQHGHGEEAIALFNDMVKLGIRADRITLLVLLNSCSHSGLVQEGLKLFESLTSGHRVIPNYEHYACLIDLLGRAGYIDELSDMLEEIPCKPNELIWNALVGVCRMHGNMVLGSKGVEKLIELDPKSSAPYILLSSIYATLGRWELVEVVRHLMKKRHVNKERAISWIDVENKVHAFTVSDSSHPLKEVINLVLQQLSDHMEEEISPSNAER